jgi:hypothetical protein
MSGSVDPSSLDYDFQTPSSCAIFTPTKEEFEERKNEQTKQTNGYRGKRGKKSNHYFSQVSISSKPSY